MLLLFLVWRQYSKGRQADDIESGDIPPVSCDIIVIQDFRMVFHPAAPFHYSARNGYDSRSMVNLLPFPGSDSAVRTCPSFSAAFLHR